MIDPCDIQPPRSEHTESYHRYLPALQLSKLISQGNGELLEVRRFEVQFRRRDAVLESSLQGLAKHSIICRPTAAQATQNIN
jgi:hypothetical protein